MEHVVDDESETQSDTKNSMFFLYKIYTLSLVPILVKLYNFSNENFSTLAVKARVIYYYRRNLFQNIFNSEIC